MEDALEELNTKMCTEWNVSMAWEFSQAVTEGMSSARQARVLITNPPSSFKEIGNLRDSTTVNEMLILYLNQYKVNRVFHTTKSEFDMNSIYIHMPSRANLFMFVIFLGTIVAGIVNAVMCRKGLLKTAESMIDNLSFLIIKPDS